VEGIYLDPARRHDFVFLFDVTDGNPNGDPDAGNLPRVDPETMQGLVSDVALKRKVRDYVDTLRGGEERFKIYVQSGTALDTQQSRAYTALGFKPKRKDQDPKEVDRARRWMCENFYDIRMFGAVMGVGENRCGQVRGPIQLTFARSTDPIMPLDLSITRVAVTNPKETREEEDAEARIGTMGRKAMVPYGLYRAHGFFNPHFAAQSGADREDLTLFWNALQNMFELDRSSARGMMAVQGLYVFSHESALGNAPAHRLFGRISVSRKPEVKAPRSFSDYAVSVAADGLPASVQLTRLVE
jgi:CRISPR-associated protein Csd2